MRCYISVVCALSVLAAVSYAAPASLQQQSATLSEQANTLLSVESDSEGSTSLSGRFRRNIQLLRQLCPPLFQVIDNVIQNITSQIFRVVGRVVLQSGGLGGGGGGGGESQVSVVLPTFPPDDDEDEDEDEDEGNSNGDTNQEGGSDSNVIAPASSVDAFLKGLAQVRFGGGSNDEIESPKAQTTTENSLSFDIKVVQQGNVVNTIPLTGDNSVDGNEVDGNPSDTPGTQTPFTSPSSASDDTVRASRRIRAAEDDQEAAASGGNGPNPAEDLSNVDAEDADRDKRYLPFGGGDAHAAGGGSGNFLFDIIRLIAGSGATEESDEKENAAAGAGGVAEVDIAKSEDGYTEGIPGPITRLFVIANRGLANLIQDLILRLAQTSERIVNFKARLITAVI